MEMRFEAALESAIAVFAIWQISGQISGTDVIGQVVDPAASIPWTEIVKEWGGLALSAWLVIHHTMYTIPRMQADSKAERESLVASHREELDEKRQDYMRQLSEQADLHRTEITQMRTDFFSQMQALQKTFETAIERQSCRFNQQ